MSDVARIIEAAKHVDPTAADQLLPLIYLGPLGVNPRRSCGWAVAWTWAKV